jgi:hypothetical protein
VGGLFNDRSMLLVICLLSTWLIQACSPTGQPNGGDQPGVGQTISTPGASQPDELEQAMTLEQALATPLEDDRQQILEQMGPPDVFKITLQELNGQHIRQEEWSYFDDQTRFDFVNGALLWTITISPAADMSLNASTYNPMSFTDAMTLQEVQTSLGDQLLTQIQLTEYGVPDGLALVGDQILLGFEGGKLVSVQTFELEPGVAQ